MTVARLTMRRTKLHKHKSQVIADLLEGMSAAQVAAKYKVARQSVYDFQERNKAEILNARSELVEQTKDAWLADKNNRIREAQKYYGMTEEWLQEHGLSERTVRYDKDGNEIGETIRFRRDVVDMQRALRREVAEELGQLPKSDQNINIRQQVLIRQIEGVNPEELG